MRSRDGVSVDEGEELLEDGEEGPVGEDADALLYVEAAAADWPAVHHAEQTEPDALPLRQQLSGEGLVELERGTVDLQKREQSEEVYWSLCFVLLQEDTNPANPRS